LKLAYCAVILAALLLFAVPWQTAAAPQPHIISASRPAYAQVLDVQAFLDSQPGVLKSYSDEGQSAATLLESSGLYYSLHPHLYLVLLETVSSLLSDPAPPDAVLRQPFGAAGPVGFSAQIEWASQELRAGLGPYNGPVTLQFGDGTTVDLDMALPPEQIAIQRFLSLGHTQDEWRVLTSRFEQVLQDYFQEDLFDLFGTPSLDERPDSVPAPSEGIEAAGGGFLMLPWPAGTRVHHLAYFDHVYPTVDTIPDGNNMVMTYLGRMDVQYNTHDGHDFSFPDQLVGTPILAAAPGLAYARTMRGNGVVILHENGYETVYWHLNSFAPRFHGVIDSNQGVWVEAGDTLGTSGSSGFTVGTPHLHFEVRHYGRQVDPYGWYGVGPDPCAAYAACVASPWLWHDSLRGSYDFTPPSEGSNESGQQPERDTPPDFLQPGASSSRGGSEEQEDNPPPPPQDQAPPQDTPTPLAPPAGPTAAPVDPTATAQPQASVPSAGPAHTPPDDDVSAALSQPPPAATSPADALPPQGAAVSIPAAPGDPAVSIDDATNATNAVNAANATDQLSPTGTLSIQPLDDLLLYVPFDGHVLQHVGVGTPVVEGEPAFVPGQYGQALKLTQREGLTYPVTENIRLDVGSISLWAYVPEDYPPSSVDRHYLFAASAHPKDLRQGIYTGTLALRRDLLGPDDAPRWDFWTTPQQGEDARDDLAAADTLDPGWHHFAITWDAEQDSKALYLNGKLVAETDDAVLPDAIGPVLQLGRFTTGNRQSGMLLDELAIFGRILEPDEIADLAAAGEPLPASATVVQTSTLLLDTNALDTQSGISAIQMGRDGKLAPPVAFHDTLRWQLPEQERPYTLEARYIDGAGNVASVTRTVVLDLPPRGEAAFASSNELTATLAISATDQQQPIMMQISTRQSFFGAPWRPLETMVVWHWKGTQASEPSAERPALYVRFRDAGGQLSEPVRVTTPFGRVYLPLFAR
jgi:murein DD-endopeptidase MepM/ murein hydrolase activator NlpD